MPREEEGVAIAAGLALAGRRPLMVFQDNGIGNLLTVAADLPQAYHLPLFGVVTRRGGLGEYNSMIHTVSEQAEALLDAAARALVPARRAARRSRTGRRRSSAPGRSPAPRTGRSSCSST